MTKKRYKLISDDENFLVVTFNGNELSQVEVVQTLNGFIEENEQLKEAINTLKHRHSLLHDVCIEAEFDRDWYYKDVVSLEKENEKLREEIKRLKSINGIKYGLW